MTTTELVAILRGKRLNCKCHAHSSSECGSSDCGEWPETYCGEAADMIELLQARVADREAEILRLRTNETASAHALDTLRQQLLIDLITGEHAANTGKRIRTRIGTLLAAMDDTAGGGA